MRLKKLTVGLFILAGVLYVVAGLRDLYAPGFFNISPRIPSRMDIVIQFVLAATFFVLASLSSRNQNVAGTSKK
jgi:hypothetical protein